MRVKVDEFALDRCRRFALPVAVAGGPVVVGPVLTTGRIGPRKRRARD